MTLFSKINKSSLQYGAVVFYFLLMLTVLSAWFFAHEYVVQNLNAKSANKQNLLAEQAYDFVWKFTEPDDVVSLFDTQWFTNSHGFGFVEDVAKISVNFRGHSVIKPIHQELVVKLGGVDKEIKDLLFSLEFSDLDSGLYYHSQEVRVSSGINVIELSELKWQAAQQNNSALKPATWQAMKRLSTLVLRFSNPRKQQIILEYVKIPQQQAATEEVNTVQLPCGQNITKSAALNISSFCWNSNIMSSLQRKLATSGQLKQLSFVPLNVISPWLWLLLSFLSVATLVTLFANPGKGKASFSAVLLTFLVVALLHRFELLLQWELLQWPLLVLAVLMLWLYRGVFNCAVSKAWPVWFFTGMLSFILFWLGGHSFEFIQQLPMYLLWGTVQQIILGPIVTDFFRKRLAVNDLAVSMLVAFIFTVLHSPNHTLMMATFLGGFVWSYSWQKYRNIYVNIVSHSLLALLFYQAIPTVWLGSARIGAFF